MTTVLTPEELIEGESSSTIEPGRLERFQGACYLESASSRKLISVHIPGPPRLAVHRD